MDHKSTSETEDVPPDSQEPDSRVVVTDEWVTQEPIETPQRLEAFKSRLVPTYRHYFTNDEEFELFCMLPVNEHERKVLVERLVKRREQKDGPSE